ncbi:fibronectin type III domain-containing protein [Patescibacteria group bacterium]
MKRFLIPTASKIGGLIIISAFLLSFFVEQPTFARQLPVSPPSGCQELFDCQFCDCPTPTATPTPTPTLPVTPPTGSNPTATPTPTDAPPSIPGGPVYQCNNAMPDTPTITSAKRTSSVTITWTKVSNANDYAIVYGPTSGDYPHSVFSTGDTDNFTINGINSGCFRVKAINGCMPGELSAEVCTGGIGGGQVLGASTLADTGSTNEYVFGAIMATGLLITAFGIKKNFS